MANKPTKRDRYAEIRNLIPADRSDLLAFIDHEVELLDKKNSAKHKPTARQAENASLMDVIYDGMEYNKQYTVSDLIAEIPALAGMNTQRVAPLLTKMKENVLVAREVVKGKAYFSKI